MHATGLGQVMSSSLFVVAIVYRTVFTVLGGYITARLSPGRASSDVLALGIIGLLIALIGTIATWDKGLELGPKWYPIALVVLALPSCWLGRILYRER
jgi:hypothetical protein